MPAQPLQFLIIDDNADTRFILARTMGKEFPDAVLQECWGTDDAMQRGAKSDVAAIIVHRTTEMTGVYFVQWLRKANPTAPILMVSSADRTHAALAAGANRFMLFDDWKLVGSAVRELMQQHVKAAAPEASVA
jgi:DNA-binding response OmpR family regulator